jgi:pyrroline-5-carboxylate reductase
MNKKIGIIGFGSMGSMLVTKFIESCSIENNNLYVSNRRIEKMDSLTNVFPSIHICNSNYETADASDIIIICTKPLEIRNVLDEIKPALNFRKHLISINGSLKLENIESVYQGKISKIMPSLTAEINKSITLVCHNNLVTDTDKQCLLQLLEILGEVYEIPEEEFGMASELTSCMPGLLASMFDILSNSAKKHTSLSEDTIRLMIMKTVHATAQLMLEKKMNFTEMIERVATKGGITEVGTRVLEENLPEVYDQLFEKTLLKRKDTVDKLVMQFMKTE